jgi:hypothetical protein
MARKSWSVWTWDDGNRAWLETAEGITEAEAHAGVEARRAGAERLNVSGAWVAMPKGTKPHYIPEGEPDAVIFDAEEDEPEPESGPEVPYDHTHAVAGDLQNVRTDAVIMPRGIVSWAVDCTCDPGACGYEDGDCPMCVVLPHALPCPKDDTYGVNAR